MKKLIIIIFSVCILLTGCAKEQKVKQIFDDESNESTESSIEKTIELNSKENYALYKNNKLEGKSIKFEGTITSSNEYFVINLELENSDKYDVLVDKMPKEEMLFKIGDHVYIQGVVYTKGNISYVTAYWMNSNSYIDE